MVSKRFASWLLGDDLLRNRANVVAFDVGAGSVITIGSQLAFRAQTRATFKPLFNAIFQGPASAVDADTLSRLR